MGTPVKVIRDFGEFKSGDVIDTLEDYQIESHLRSGDVALIEPAPPVNDAE